MTKRTARKRHVFYVVLALGGLSLYQFVDTGEVKWFAAVQQELATYLNRPESGWRKATDALNEAAPGTPRKFDIEGRVVRISDGDTISVLDHNKQQYKIRFYGIDAPELGQAYGKAARKALTGLLDGADVSLVVVDVDDYQRQVATVYVGAENINTAMVAQGYAWWYRYHARNRQDLRDAETQARAEGRGLWAAPDPEPPWDWRRRNR